MNTLIANRKDGKMTAHYLLLLVTATSTGLIAGLLYAYSCSVNPGLGKLPDEGYITAMQSINREIQNPVFFASFMGTLILLPVCTWLHYKTGASTVSAFLLAATIVYAAGVFGVTMAGNVPLNEALDKFRLSTATVEEIANARARFESSWNRLHTIRTLAAIAALVLVIIACLNRSPVSDNR